MKLQDSELVDFGSIITIEYDGDQERVILACIGFQDHIIISLEGNRWFDSKLVGKGRCPTLAELKSYLIENNSEFIDINGRMTKENFNK